MAGLSADASFYSQDYLNKLLKCGLPAPRAQAFGHGMREDNKTVVESPTPRLLILQLPLPGRLSHNDVLRVVALNVVSAFERQYEFVCARITFYGVAAPGGPSRTSLSLARYHLQAPRHPLQVCFPGDQSDPAEHSALSAQPGTSEQACNQGTDTSEALQHVSRISNLWVKWHVHASAHHREE